MKNSFRVFALMLVALFSVAFIGCGGDDEDEAGGDIVTPAATPTPMEQLAGKYTVAEVSVEAEGAVISLKPPEVFGELNLSVGGGPWSWNYLFQDGDKVDESGSSWNANRATITFGGPSVPYTWDGTYFAFSVSLENGLKVSFKWQKL